MRRMLMAVLVTVCTSGAEAATMTYWSLFNIEDETVIDATYVTYGSCLIPWFDGVILSIEWKEALWDKFVTAAPRPRTQSEQQYSDRKLRWRR